MSSVVAAPPSLSGPLYKKRRSLSWLKLPIWEQRLVSLDNEALIYSKRRGSGHKKSRSLTLDGCTITPLIKQDKPGKCVFEVSHPSMKRPLRLAAPTPKEREEWVDALTTMAITTTRRRNSAPTAMAATTPSTSTSTSSSTSTPTSVVPSHLKARAEEANEIAHTLAMKEDTWTQFSDRKGVKGYRATAPNGLNMGKGIGIINHHPISILLAIIDYPTYPQVDVDMQYATRLDVFNSHTFLDRFFYKGIWPFLGDRELYVGNTWHVLPGGVIHLNCYSEPEDTRPEDKSVVRAYCPAGGWFIRPLNPEFTSCEVTYYCMVDIKGDITKIVPKSIIDRVNENQAQQVANIRTLLEKDVKSQKGHYTVNTQGLSSLTEEVVASYVHGLHRRTLTDLHRYNWLKTDTLKTSCDTDTTTTTTATTPATTNTTEMEVDAIMANLSQTTSRSLHHQEEDKRAVGEGKLVKRNNPAQTAWSFIVIIISMLVGTTVVQLAGN